MDKCISICLKYPPSNLPDQCYDKHGRVKLDLDTTTFEKSKKVEELTEFDTISGAGVLGFNLLNTPCNRAILKSYGNPTAFGFDQSICIDVIACEGSLTLDQDVLQVRQRTKEGWEVELIEGDDFWKTSMQNMKLCDIECPLFDFTVSNIRDSWDNPVWQDGDSGLHFPLVHYGNWTVPAVYDDDGVLIAQTYVSPEDFRPWFHILPLLQKAFCQNGWKFKSPILESDWGRSLIAYLSPDYKNLESETAFGFKAGWVEQINLNGDDFNFNLDSAGIFYDDGGGGPTGFYNTMNPNYNANFLNGDYCFTLSFEVDPNQFFFGQQFQTMITVGGVNYLSPLYTYDGTTNVFSFTTPIITDLIQNSASPHFVPGLGLPASSLVFGDNNFFQGSAKRLVLQEGRTYNPSSFLRCDKNVLDLFKGILHLIGGGKIVTDKVNKCVTVYHPDTIAEMHDGTSPEPFYKDNKYSKIPLRLVCKDETTDILATEVKRFQQLSFCEPEDCYVKEILRREDPDNPLYGKRIDLGTAKGQSEETEYLINECFEATGQILAEDLKIVKPISALGINAFPEIPALWDNCDNEISCDLKPRILVACGGVTQYRGLDDSSVPIYANWLFDDGPIGSTPGIETIVPFAFQITDQLIGDGLSDLPTRPNKNVVYGSDPKDLHTLFWARKLIEQTNGLDKVYQGQLTNCEYQSIDFREFFTVEYCGECFKAKLIELSGFESCSNAPGQLVFRPQIYDESLECLDPIFPENECTLSVIITVQFINQTQRELTANEFGCFQAISYNWFKDGVALNLTTKTILDQGPGVYRVEVAGCGCNAYHEVILN